jgi:3-deoxy-D-manno-octulosonate 8-phosphate phosphatase (KDO 8-P phosphatase)
MQALLKKAAKIKLLISDVDGVFTDGKIYIADDGSEYKAFDAKDGIGIKLLLRSGVDVAIISGRKSATVEHRMHALGVKHIYQNQDHKLTIFNELVKKLNLNYDNIAYIGDDAPDVPLIIKAGLGIAVADATLAAREHADFVTTAKGGCSAIREVCELIMRSQNTLAQQLQFYFNYE